MAILKMDLYVNEPKCYTITFDLGFWSCIETDEYK